MLDANGLGQVPNMNVIRSIRFLALDSREALTSQDRGMLDWIRTTTQVRHRPAGSMRIPRDAVPSTARVASARDVSNGTISEPSVLDGSRHPISACVRRPRPLRQTIASEQASQRLRDRMSVRPFEEVGVVPGYNAHIQTARGQLRPT